MLEELGIELDYPAIGHDFADWSVDHYSVGAEAKDVLLNLIASFDWDAWPLPRVFQWLAETGGVSDHEMRRTFNCGVGFILIVAPENAEPVLAALLNAGETAFVCGQLEAA